MLFATDVSMIAYLFTRIDDLSKLQIVIVLIALFLATIAIIIVNKKAIRKIEEIEEL